MIKFQNKGEVNELHLIGVVGWSFTSQEVEEALTADEVDTSLPLNIYLDSPGGFIHDGFRLLGLLSTYKGEKHVRVGYQASSIASFLALAGKTLRMSSVSEMIVHSCNVTYALATFTLRDVEDLGAMMRGMNKRLKEAYKSIFKGKSLDQEHVQGLAKKFGQYVDNGRDNILTAGDLEELQLCDEVLSLDQIVPFSSMQEMRESYSGYLNVKNETPIRDLFLRYKDFQDFEDNGTDEQKEQLQNLVSREVNNDLFVNLNEHFNQLRGVEMRDQEIDLMNSSSDEEEKEKEQENNDTEEEKEEEKENSTSSSDDEEEAKNSAEEEDEDEDTDDDEEEEEKKKQEQNRVADLATKENKRRDDIIKLFEDRLDVPGMANLMTECLKNKVSVDKAKDLVLDKLHNMHKTKVEEVTIVPKNLSNEVNYREMLLHFMYSRLDYSNVKADWVRAIKEKFNGVSPKEEQLCNQFLQECNGNSTKTAEAQLENMLRKYAPEGYLNRSIYATGGGTVDRFGLTNLTSGDFEYLTLHFYSVFYEEAKKREDLDQLLKLTKNIIVPDLNPIKIFKNITPVTQFERVGEEANTKFIDFQYKQEELELYEYGLGFKMTYNELHMNTGSINLFFDKLQHIAKNYVNTLRVRLLQVLTGVCIKAEADKVPVFELAVDEPIYVGDLLAKIRLAYGSLVDSAGTPYNVTPKYLLGNLEVKEAFETFFTQSILPGAVTAEFNPYRGYLEGLYDVGVSEFNKAISYNENDIFILPEDPCNLYSLGPQGVTNHGRINVTPEQTVEVRSRLDFQPYVMYPEHVLHIKFKKGKKISDLLLPQRPVHVVTHPTTAQASS
ncbi:hypothetical protein CKF54_00445 [Psittacicella hinzii]|uniref:ATP-dependent Clp protease proteolytic subunit n=1 Tax=Psittacicella hinzii TaxID=2028575 RepID=A0A3A1YB93_9GAMM|nr:ATP-dependent Clp protease proteolytic subunit [Psittacicella hinzii]RIY34499.1 hypothetical protein CKF54_00445 [Psittacicella hinzii]